MLLTGGTVFDGTGAPGIQRDLGYADGRILDDHAMAALADDPGRVSIDVTGWVVCPGFVDIHTHSDLTLLSNPLGASKIRQGVTTEVVGNCGLGLAPVLADDDPRRVADIATMRAAVGYLDLDPTVPISWRDFGGYLDALRAARPAINVAALVPHLALRASVIGMADRTAGPAQRELMCSMLADALDAGAVGLSTGLMYAPLLYADDAELVALGEVVARRDRIFAWHVRDYATDLIPSVQQALSVARATGCRTQISHLTSVGRRNWGLVRQALDLVDAARAEGLDVGVDIYPYLAGNAPLSQLLPEWAQEGGAEVFAERLRAADFRGRIFAQWQDRYWDWADIVVNAITGRVDGTPAQPPPNLLGRTISELAAEQSRDAADVVMDLLAVYGAGVMMVAFGRSEDDLRAVLSHPAAVVASDGQALDPHGPTGSGLPHPRCYGTFPQYLAGFASDLADGIRRCTSAPAERVRLDRGRVQPGAVADLVVFDPADLADQATFDEPHQFPRGIKLVIVGGEIVIDATGDAVRDTGARPGRILGVDSTASGSTSAKEEAT